MRASIWRRVLALLLCAVILPVNVPAKADSLQTAADEIIIAAIAVGAAIGIGVFYAIHHTPSLKGCAVAGPDGLELKNEGDQKTYLLTGDTAGVKAGERVRVAGKKKAGKGATGDTTFLVEKLKKNYGACPATTTP